MSRLVKAAGITAAAAALGIAVERLTLASPPYQGPKSDHFDGRKFLNLQQAHREEGSFLKWQLTKQQGPWRDWVAAPPGPPPPARVDGGRARITFVNHATMLIQLDGVNVLTDPIWSDRCSPVQWAGPKRHRPPGIRFEDLPKIDAVLVSHNHYDHLDIGTLRRLRATHEAPILTPLGNSALMKRHDVDGAVDLDWWQSVPLTESVKITLVPSQHFCSRGISDRDRTLWGGFVISGPSGNVYFAGDTGWGGHFAEIGRRFAPIRVALLPIGAYLPRWFMKPVHVDPAEAVEAHLVLGAKTSIPMHYGTFRLGDDGEIQPLDDLRKAMAAKGNPRIEVLDFGEGRDLP